MRSQFSAFVRGFHSRHNESSSSAAGQPEPIPHGMQTSESVAVAQHVVALFPFADETKIREHAISSSHLRSFRTPISFLLCAFIVTLAVFFPGARVPPAATRR